MRKLLGEVREELLANFRKWEEHLKPGYRPLYEKMFCTLEAVDNFLLQNAAYKGKAIFICHYGLGTVERINPVPENGLMEFISLSLWVHDCRLEIEWYPHATDVKVFRRNTQVDAFCIEGKAIMYQNYQDKLIKYIAENLVEFQHRLTGPSHLEN